MSGSDGLMDFQTGLQDGAVAGYKLGGAPGGVVGGLALGALSYFGGAEDRRRLEKNNKYAEAGYKNDLTLGSLSIMDARRKVKVDQENQKRKELFGTMLAQYFQRQGSK